MKVRYRLCYVTLLIAVLFQANGTALAQDVAAAARANRACRNKEAPVKADLAKSFEEAAALGEAQEKERATQAYIHLDLMPYYEKKYSPVFQSCLTSTDHPDTSTFSFVVAIGKDGCVLRLYIDHETNIFACVRQTLQQDEFPHPPLCPYYLHVSMSFSK